MDKINTREVIKQKAVLLFSEKGFHGTSIRDIAAASGCSLPMLYYYYNNKNDLFEEVACHEFVRLTERLNASVTTSGSLQDIYFQAIRQRKELNSYDRGVFKLAMKVFLGFDGSRDVREKLLVWENERWERTKKILTKACSDPETLSVFSNIMVRILQNMMERIILMDEEISDEEIKKEIDFMMNAVQYR